MHNGLILLKYWWKYRLLNFVSSGHLVISEHMIPKIKDFIGFGGLSIIVLYCLKYLQKDGDIAMDI